MNFGVGLLVISILLWQCTPKEKAEDFVFLQPEHFPVVEINDAYPITPALVDLGKRLFFENILSSDSSISCGTCHKQEFAFADNRDISPGVHGNLGTRNAQALQNLSWAKTFFRDGTIRSLHLVSLAPLDTDFEMNMTHLEMLDRLQKHEAYPKLFQDIFNEPISEKNTVYALVAFMRTLISHQSPYDAFVTGDSSALSDSQLRGLSLFNGKALCSTCHVGINFSDENYHNIGLHETYPDNGRQRFTFDPNDAGKFKTPNLRNVAVTAPFMHNSLFHSLEEVIEHYNKGGENHPMKDPRVQSLNLSQNEKSDLLNFLKSLTDTNFLTNASFAP